jgi:hypothetical protein
MSQGWLVRGWFSGSVSGKLMQGFHQAWKMISLSEEAIDLWN